MNNPLTTAKDWITGQYNRLEDWAISTAQGVVSNAKDSINGLIGSVSKVMPNMLPTVAACLATLSYRGTQGNFATVSYPIVLTASFLDIAGIAPDKYGYPYCKNRPLSNFDGFVLCQNARCTISGTIIEEQAIEEFLNGGVYLDWRF